MWNKLAETSPISVGDIVLLKGVKVTEFNGCRNLTITPVTNVLKTSEEIEFQE